MPRKNLATLILVGLAAAIFAWILSGLLFKSPAKNAQAPTAPAISSSFPDVKNDPIYKSFLNSQALDPTQNIQVGNSSNSTPFSGGR